jgi:hypothetical protein
MDASFCLPELRSSTNHKLKQVEHLSESESCSDSEFESFSTEVDSDYEYDSDYENSLLTLINLNIEHESTNNTRQTPNTPVSVHKISLDTTHQQSFSHTKSFAKIVPYHNIDISKNLHSVARGAIDTLIEILKSSECQKMYITPPDIILKIPILNHIFEEKFCMIFLGGLNDCTHNMVSYCNICESMLYMFIKHINENLKNNNMTRVESWIIHTIIYIQGQNEDV